MRYMHKHKYALIQYLYFVQNHGWKAVTSNFISYISGDQVALDLGGDWILYKMLAGSVLDVKSY